MVDHPPDDLEPVGDALERLDELPPAGLDALLELLELGLLRRECGRERERVMSLSEASERASNLGIHANPGSGWMAYESREEVADAGSDVAGVDAVEGREVEVGGEEGVVVGGGHGGGRGGEGGAGGRGGACPGAEGA